MNTLAENLDELIASSSLLILEVGDSACAPCHAIRSKIDAWVKAHPSASARYVPLKDNLALCAQMGIMSVPTVIAWADGNVVSKESGYFSLVHIFERLDRLLEIRGNHEEESNEQKEN